MTKHHVKSVRREHSIESDHLPMGVQKYRRTSSKIQSEEQWKERKVWTGEGVD